MENEEVAGQDVQEVPLYLNVVPIHWLNEEQTLLDVTLDHVSLGTIPFTADANDTASFGTEIINSAHRGDYGDIPAYVPPPPPTPEQVQQQLTDAVQAYLDNKAQERGYDGILSLATYANSTNLQFSAEGLAGVQWRDDTWAACYVILDEVMVGKRTIQAADELIAELPVLHWPDEAL